MSTGVQLSVFSQVVDEPIVEESRSNEHQLPESPKCSLAHPDRVVSTHTDSVGHADEPTYNRAETEITVPEVTYTDPTPPSYAEANGIENVESLPESKDLRHLRIICAFCSLFLAGWNGGSTGALLPYIERAFGINYARVSVLFVSTFIGYVVAAVCTGTLSRKLGFGKAMCLALVVQLIGNVINSSQGTNFSLMCFGFFVVGLSFATQLGLCNAYFALLPKPLMWTGFLHGIYGLGAFASPLVSTAMVTRGVPYHLFYTTNIGMNVPVLALTYIAFGKLKALPAAPGSTSGVTDASLRDTMSSRAVWTLSIFMMLYVGAEETIGGWIVSYILEVRNGSPEGASWVAASFYLGIALGRLLLPSLALTLKLSERPSVFLYLALATLLTLLSWLIPHLASTATSTALTGLAISTFYTAAITTGGKLLPRSNHADAFALMSSVGQVGSAVFPLLVGVMSTKRGIWIVEPTVVALLGAQGVCWFLVPKVERRMD